MDKQEINELRAAFGLKPVPEEYRTGTVIYKGSMEGKQMIIDKYNKPLSNYDMNKVIVLRPPKGVTHYVE